MNSDQQANVEGNVTALVESLFSAWSHFHLLRGIHEGVRQHPIVLERFDQLFDQMWQAAFDGFFAKAGILLDRSKNTYSLHSLITQVRKLNDSNLKPILHDIETCLAEEDSTFAKIKKWRHEVVAHHTKSGCNSAFYIDNKMNLDDLEGALTQLEALLNRVSIAVLGVHNDTRESEYLVEEGIALFACLAAQANAHVSTSLGLKSA
jgi:hypothetical protein